MPIYLIDKIKQKNEGTFKLMDAIDVETSDGSSVQEKLDNLIDNNIKNTVDTYDDLPDVSIGGLYIVRSDVNNQYSTSLYYSDGTKYTLIGGIASHGIDGREVEFSVNETHIIWKYAGEEDWINLISIDSLKGEDGHDGQDGVNGVNGREIHLQVSDTHIQWQYVGDDEWIDLIPLESLKGEKGEKGEDGVIGQDGREVEIGVIEETISWRYAGEETWNTIVPLSSLKGEKGDQGEKGEGSNVPELIAGDNIEFEIDEINNTITIHASGGGEGGTTDYTELENKPKINNVEIDGELTLEELGIRVQYKSYENSELFPTIGDSEILYLDKSTNILYRWNEAESKYIPVSSASSGLELGETEDTAYYGDKGKIAYDHSQLTEGNPHNVTKTEIGLGNVDNTSDLDKPISTVTQVELDKKIESVNEILPDENGDVTITASDINVTSTGYVKNLVSSNVSTVQDLVDFIDTWEVSSSGGDGNANPPYIGNFVIGNWTQTSDIYSLTYTPSTHGQGYTKALFVQVYQSDSVSENVYLSYTISNTGVVVIQSNSAFNGYVLISNLNGGNSLPSGGLIGEVLVKQSSQNGDANWQDIHEIFSLDNYYTKDDVDEQIGKVGTKDVDESNITNGSTLIYSANEDKYIVSIPALGAEGEGIRKTNNFTLADNEEVIISHQPITDGRAMYFAEKVVDGENNVLYNQKVDKTVSHLFVHEDMDKTELNTVVSTDGFSNVTNNSNYGWLRKKLLDEELNTNWDNTGNIMPVTNRFFGTIVVGDKIYFYGGNTAIGVFSDKIYYALLDKPTVLIDTGFTLPSAISLCYPIIVGNKIYFYGGSNGSPQNSIWYANVSTPHIVVNSGNTLPQALQGVTPIIIGDYIYIFGGNIVGGITKNIIRAHVSNPTSFTVVGTMPTELTRFTYYIDNTDNKIYFYGGNTLDDNVQSNKIYYALLNSPETWLDTGYTLPLRISNIERVKLGDYVYLFGGYSYVPSSSIGQNKIYRFNVNSPLIVEDTGKLLPVNIYAHAMVKVDNKLYIYAGYNYVAGEVGTYYNTIYSNTLTQTFDIDTSYVISPKFALATFSKIKHLYIYGTQPENTSMKFLVSFDEGETYKYYNGTSWVTAVDIGNGQSLSDPNSFDNAMGLVAVDDGKYEIEELQNYIINHPDDKYIQFAVDMGTNNDKVAPTITGYDIIVDENPIYEALTIGGYNSLFADLGLKHVQGDYTVTTLKNLTGGTITLIVKVCDGTVNA